MEHTDAQTICMRRDDVVKITSELHDHIARKSHLHNKKRKKTQQRAPVWCQSNTLRRSNQNYSRNSRVLEKGKLCVPRFMMVLEFL